MKKMCCLLVTLLFFTLGLLGCETTPKSTLNEATQDIQKGISGQGQLQEKSWEDVEVYQ